jgi:ankyrin repeat protein
VAKQNSTLLVMLEFVDPNELFGGQEESSLSATLLHHLADLADPFDYSTHETQLILVNQLLEPGANVNAVSNSDSMTLHQACFSANATNLDFVDCLLKEGADPNTQNYYGRTPLIFILPDAPGAAKFLLNWPTTDANITR